MSMTAEQWQQVKTLLEQTLEQPPDDRLDWLEKNCPDAETRDEVWSLVLAHIEIEDFLEKPSHTGAELVSALKPDSLIGERIGSWRLVEEIGRGGMGTGAPSACLRRVAARPRLPADMLPARRRGSLR